MNCEHVWYQTCRDEQVNIALATDYQSYFPTARIYKWKTNKLANCAFHSLGWSWFHTNSRKIKLSISSLNYLFNRWWTERFSIHVIFDVSVARTGRRRQTRSTAWWRDSYTSRLNQYRCLEWADGEASHTMLNHHRLQNMLGLGEIWHYKITLF